VLTSTDWEGAAAVCSSLPNEETENEKSKEYVLFRVVDMWGLRTLGFTEATAA
jgi:hypothetical protein